MAPKKKIETSIENIEKPTKTTKKSTNTTDVKPAKTTRKSADAVAEKPAKTTRKSADTVAAKTTKKSAETAVPKPEKTTKKSTEKIEEDYNLKYFQLLDSYNSLKKAMELTKDENDNLQLQVIELQHINASLTAKMSNVSKNIVPQQTPPQPSEAERPVIADAPGTLLNADLADKIIKIKTRSGNYLYATGGKLIIGAKRANSDGYLFKVEYKPKSTNTFLFSVAENLYLKVNRDNNQIILVEQPNKYSRVLLNKDEKGRNSIVSKEFEAGNWNVDDNCVKISKNPKDFWTIEVVEK